MKKNVLQHWITLPRTLVLSALVAVVLTFVMLLPPLATFITTDAAPQLIPLVPQKEADVGGAIAEIKTGLYIHDFPVFDIVKNKFIVDAIVWFQFDPRVISLETVGNFSFEKGTILKRTDPDTKMINGELFARYMVRIELASTLDYKFFPINDHRIFIVLANQFVTPSEMRYKVSEAGFVIAPKIYAQGWTPIDKTVRAGYSIARLDRYDEKKVVKHPRAVFSIDFEKAGLRKVLLILIPIILLFFLGLFSLIFDHDRGARAILSLSVGSLSGLLAYRFVIEKLSPEVGYFTLTDHAYTLILTLTFILFLFNMYVMRKKYTPQMQHIKSIFFLSIETFFLAVWYYLLYWWGR